MSLRKSEQGVRREGGENWGRKKGKKRDSISIYANRFLQKMQNSSLNFTTVFSILVFLILMQIPCISTFIIFCFLCKYTFVPMQMQKCSDTHEMSRGGLRFRFISEMNLFIYFFFLIIDDFSEFCPKLLGRRQPACALPRKMQRHL